MQFSVKLLTHAGRLGVKVEHQEAAMKAGGFQQKTHSRCSPFGRFRDGRCDAVAKNLYRFASHATGYYKQIRPAVLGESNGHPEHESGSKQTPPLAALLCMSLTPNPLSPTTPSHLLPAKISRTSRTAGARAFITLKLPRPSRLHMVPYQKVLHYLRGGASHPHCTQRHHRSSSFRA